MKAYMLSLAALSIALASNVCATVDPIPEKRYSPDFNSNDPYGLVDLDHFSDGYGYCGWGNPYDLLDPLKVEFEMKKLAADKWPLSRADLWLNTGGTASLRWDVFPSTTIFDSSTRIVTLFPDRTSTPPVQDPPYSVFCKLHFPRTLTDEVTNSLLKSDTRKVIVLIHGWNPDSNTSQYGYEFAALKANLIAKLAGTGWKLVCYDWAMDADTGSSAPGDAVQAAEIAHRHGQHLGQLLAHVAPNGNLQKVQFIAHSAGTWAARSAARYLTQETSTKIEITLLDPFTPSKILTASTSLSTSVINQLPQMDGSYSLQLYSLENYFAVDALHNTSFIDWGTDSDAIYGATSVVFDHWRDRDQNFRIDWQASGGPTTEGTQALFNSMRIPY